MKTLLFNPGPTNVSEKVRNAIKTRDICHREPEFFNLLLDINKKLIKILNGQDTHSSVAFVSSATGCNEAVISSIHGKILLIKNGKYSERLQEIANTYNIPTNVVEFDPLKPIGLDKVEDVLKKDSDITHILAVHHETTTGMITPSHEIGELAKKYNKILAVDTVSSLGGYKIDLKKSNIDFCIVNANKCLESFPGISFVIGRTSEIEKLKGKSRSFYFDLYKQWKKQKKGETPFTPAVQLFFALNQALDEFLEEGYDNRVKRYEKNSAKMRAELKKLGFEFVLPEGTHSRILTAIKIPPNFDYWKVHDKLKKKGYTIYSDQKTLDKEIFRIATLGHITEQDIDDFLKAFEEVLEEVGFKSN